MEKTQKLLLSIVSPAFNEQDNIRSLVNEIENACKDLNGRFEIVIANDCSTDNTLTVLKELQESHKNLRVIDLSKRTGQTAALDAAIRHSRGKYIAMLDADLQNDPAEIPRMLELVISGQCDMVNGWRKDRNDPWLRLISTRVANGVRNWLTHENIHDSACGLKVFRRECMDNIKLFTGMHRFLPTLVKMQGYTVNEIPVNHRRRTAGVAKYGLWNRIFKAFRDCFAIRWMQSRNFSYDATEVCINTESE
ncbi:MAG: glycosyltransferase family 2 protein [Sedimentisphaerales bacterium]|nr:glycosyltransferase family 2 protein [Sedimentisphaerales bacterium]MBN2843298.1 glycosyltransferase family 2 protein [Sedimentisphaerales bacterium]